MAKISKEKEKYETIKTEKSLLSKFKLKSLLKLKEEIEKDIDRSQMAFPSFFQPTNDNITYTDEEIQKTEQKRKKFIIYDIKNQYQTGET